MRQRHPAAGTGLNQPHFVDNDLGHLLVQASHALSKAFEAAVRATDQSSLEWSVLGSLSGQSPPAVGQLARAKLTQLVQHLSMQAWGRLGDDPANQHRTLVQITPLFRQARGHETQALVHLGATDAVRLNDPLRQPPHPRSHTA